MKLCDSQRQAIALAKSGLTTIWIRDYRKEIKNAEGETDSAYKVGYVYSMSREVLLKLAAILAPDVDDFPTIETDTMTVKEGRITKKVPVEGAPLLLKLCDKPLEAANEFIEHR